MKKCICLFFSLLTPFLAFGQNESTKPLELPAFIIEGVEQHNVRSSVKQMPQKSNKLTSQDLDSLNSFEKQQPAMLQPDELPSHYVTKHQKTTYVKASYGLYNSPDIALGYKLFLDRFDIFASAGYASSNGSEDYADNNKLFLNIRTHYIAEDKWFIFGGSSTHTNLFLNTQNYNLYGAFNSSNNPTQTITRNNNYDKTLSQAKFEVISDGTFENAEFSVGATANYILGSSAKDINRYAFVDNLENYYLRCFLNVKNYWESFLLGGNLYLNLEDFNSHSLNFYQVDASAAYKTENLLLNLLGGFQIANNSNSVSRGGFLLSANAEYLFSPNFTLTGKVRTGLVETEFEDLIIRNPYLSPRLEIDHRYDILNIEANIIYHPTERVMASVGTELRYSQREPLFVLDSLAEFKLVYLDGMFLNTFVEGLWNVDAQNKLLGRLNFNINDVENKQNATYLPFLDFSVTYFRKIMNGLNASLEGKFASSRYTDITNGTKLNPYFLLNLNADYTYKAFTFYLKLNNLTNTHYYAWDKYYERGFFGSLGAMWQF